MQNSKCKMQNAKLKLTFSGVRFGWWRGNARRCSDMSLTRRYMRYARDMSCGRDMSLRDVICAFDA